MPRRPQAQAGLTAAVAVFALAFFVRCQRETEVARHSTTAAAEAALEATTRLNRAEADARTARDALRVALAEIALREHEVDRAFALLRAVEAADPLRLPGWSRLVHDSLASPIWRRAILVGHADEINAVRFSPDGQRIVTGSKDGTARIWRTRDGMPLHTLDRHTGEVTAVAFSPDGTRVLTGSDDGSARLWDAGSGVSVAALIGHRARIASVAFSPDGTLIATGSFDHTARLWDARDGTPRAEMLGHTQPVDEVAFTPNGQRALTSAADVRLWDAPTGAPRARLAHSREPIWKAQLNPKGTRVLTIDGDVWRIWDAHTGAEIGALKIVAPDAVFADDEHVIGAESGGLILWNVRTSARTPIAIDPPPVDEITLSPTGAHLLTRGVVNRLWDTRRWRVRASLPYEPPLLAMRPVFSGDGAAMVTISGASAQVWRVETERDHASLRPDRARSVEVVSGPDRFVTLAEDGEIALWDTHRGVKATTLFGPGYHGLSAAFASNAPLVAVSATEPVVRIVDTGDGELRGKLVGHTGEVIALSFSRDGDKLVSGGRDATARLWQIKGALLLAEFIGHDDTVWAVALHPDGQRVLTGSADHSARLWDASTGRALIRFVGHEAEVRHVAFGGEGNVFTGSADGTVRRWSTHSGALLQTFGSAASPVDVMVVSPDGSRLLTATGDGSARVWDARSGALVHTLACLHRSPVRAAAFDSGGFILTLTEEGATQVWDIDSGAELARFYDAAAPIRYAGFEAEEARLLLISTSSVRRPRLWRSVTEMRRALWMNTTACPADDGPSLYSFGVDECESRMRCLHYEARDFFDCLPEFGPSLGADL